MTGILFWVSICFIFYVYAGYPLLAALLAQLRQPLKVESNEQPAVTLIFAAHNEEKVIGKKLENSLGLDYPHEKLQIIAVDDGSTDRTAEIAEAYQARGVTLVHFDQRRGKLAALKEAINEVKGEIILFSDADNYYPPDCLKEAVKMFSNASVGAVSGGRNVIGETALGEAEGLYWKYEEFIKKQESRLGSCVGVAGDLLAIRRELFTAPPDGTINDDFTMAMSVLKQGRRVVYAPKARSYHPVGRSEREEVERRARMAAGRYQSMFAGWNKFPSHNLTAAWQIISHKYLRPYIPIAMILALSANIICLFETSRMSLPVWLRLGSPYNWIFLSAQALFYIAAGISMKYKFKGWVGKALYLPAFLVNSNLAALAGLYRYLFLKQGVSWKKAAR